MDDTSPLDEGVHRPFSKEEESALHLLKMDLDSADIRTRQGSIALFIVGGILAVVGPFFLLRDDDTSAAIGVSNLIVGVIYLGLGWYARYQPLPAFAVAATVYALIQTAGMVMDPTTIANGLIFKIVIITVLFTALKAALTQRRLQAELREKGLTLDDLRNL